jgi:hypothetical protein
LVGCATLPRPTPGLHPCTPATRPRCWKKGTLTNLYNARPAWLDNIHRQLDEAVFAAYGWPTTLTDDELLARLLEVNLARAAT